MSNQMQFEIRNRWTGAVQFTAEIEATEDTPLGVRIGLAVRWGREHGAVLHDADLRGAVLSGAVLSDAVLSCADLRDAALSDAVLSGANLRGANLSGAVLRGANLRGAHLIYANLRDANLSYANLRGADLHGADPSGAVLRGAILQHCPVEIEHIHQRVYEAASQEGALYMGTWHGEGDVCGTTHCRAGWVVHLAGDGGRALEWAMGTPAAAAMIYMASDPTLERIPDFYCDNETALEDMRRLAEAEAAAEAARGV